MSVEFRVTPIHPFTKAQAEALECVINEPNIKTAAERKGKNPSTIKNQIHGVDRDGISRTEIGVLGIVESATNERYDRRLLPALLGDSIYVEIDGESHFGKPTLINEHPFSQTQSDILILTLQGKTNQEIANILKTSIYNVKKLLYGKSNSVYHKMQSLTGRRPKKQNQLIKQLYETGLVTSEIDPLPNPDYEE